MMEQLGKLDDWDCVEKHGNPVASPIVRDYLTVVQGEQRRVGVTAKQAPSPAARSRSSHAESDSHAAVGGRAHCEDTGLGDLLRSISPDEAGI